MSLGWRYNKHVAWRLLFQRTVRMTTVITYEATKVHVIPPGRLTCLPCCHTPHPPPQSTQNLVYQIRHSIEAGNVLTVDPLRESRPDTASSQTSKRRSSSPGLDTSASYIPKPCIASTPPSSTEGLVGSTISGASGTGTTEIPTCWNTEAIRLASVKHTTFGHFPAQQCESSSWPQRVVQRAAALHACTLNANGRFFYFLQLHHIDFNRRGNTLSLPTSLTITW